MLPVCDKDEVELQFHLILVGTEQRELMVVYPKAVITAVPAPDDGCQHPKHVELPTEI